MDIIELIERVLAEKQETPDTAESVYGVTRSPFASRKSLFDYPGKGSGGLQRRGRRYRATRRAEHLAHATMIRDHERYLNDPEYRAIHEASISEEDDLAHHARDDYAEERGGVSGRMHHEALRRHETAMHRMYHRSQEGRARAVYHERASEGNRDESVRNRANLPSRSTRQNRRHRVEEQRNTRAGRTNPLYTTPARKSFDNVPPSPFALRKALSWLGSGPGGMNAIVKEPAMGPRVGRRGKKELESEEKGMQKWRRRAHAASRVSSEMRNGGNTREKRELAARDPVYRKIRQAASGGDVVDRHAQHDYEEDQNVHVTEEKRNRADSRTDAAHERYYHARNRTGREVGPTPRNANDPYRGRGEDLTRQMVNKPYQSTRQNRRERLSAQRTARATAPHLYRYVYTQKSLDELRDVYGSARRHGQ